MTPMKIDTQRTLGRLIAGVERIVPGSLDSARQRSDRLVGSWWRSIGG
jgi:hypothetical protein